MHHPDRSTLLKQLTILDFMALDLQLYLNTHPTCQDALNMYNDCIKNANTARTTYEQRYGPLTAFRSDGQADADTGWKWADEPWPWQAEYNFQFES